MKGGGRGEPRAGPAPRGRASATGWSHSSTGNVPRRHSCQLCRSAIPHLSPSPGPSVSPTGGGKESNRKRDWRSLTLAGPAGCDAVPKAVPHTVRSKQPSRVWQPNYTKRRVNPSNIRIESGTCRMVRFRGTCSTMTWTSIEGLRPFDSTRRALPCRRVPVVREQALATVRFPGALSLSSIPHLARKLATALAVRRCASVRVTAPSLTRTRADSSFWHSTSHPVHRTAHGAHPFPPQPRPARPLGRFLCGAVVSLTGDLSVSEDRLSAAHSTTPAPPPPPRLIRTDKRVQK